MTAPASSPPSTGTTPPTDPGPALGGRPSGHRTTGTARTAAGPDRTARRTNTTGSPAPDRPTPPPTAGPRAPRHRRLEDPSPGQSSRDRRPRRQRPVGGGVDPARLIHQRRPLL